MALSRLKENIYAHVSRRWPENCDELNEESARRRHRRFLGENFSEGMSLRQKSELRRRDENKMLRRGRVFELLSLQRELVFLLGLFTGGDGFAQAAGMLAIERLRHGFGDGLRAKIVRKHRRPRNRLQHGPMRVRRRDEREDHKDFTEPDEHGSTLAFCFSQVKFCSFSCSFSRDPNQRAAWQFVEERNQICVGQMDATVRRGTANRRLVAGAVNVNVARMGIHVAATVEAGFESFQPENARGDFRVRHPPPGIADWLTALENRSHRPAAADFFHDAMQSERRAVRAGNLADAKTGSGTAEFFNAKAQRRKVYFKK